MKSLLAAIFLITCFPVIGQTEFEELEFESKSISEAYKPKGRNYAFIRSKKGTSGVNKNEAADAITSAPILEIVLVFTEFSAEDKATRKADNRERWENLMQTYPEYFESYPLYTNICQCNSAGDSAAFKKMQGFYVYYEGEEGAVVEPTPEVAAEPVKKAEDKKAPVEEKKVVENKPVVNEEKAVKQEQAPVETKKEPITEAPKEPINEPVKEPITQKPVEKEAKKKVEEPVEVEDDEPEQPAVKVAAKKRPVAGKPRRSKDAKACRSACYGFGDEDLNEFFKTNVVLSKKQKKKGKQQVAMVQLQLHFDGTIKKAMVTGQNSALNEQVQTAIKGMNAWNAAVKNGLAVKSNVKFTLKYDSSTKSLKANDIMITPRLGPKCVCVSDEEIFGGE